MSPLPQARRVSQVIVAVVAAISLLLLGAALGLLVRVPSFDRAEPEPTAVDVGFSQDMSVHHQQAVTMATLARERADDVAVRQLAFDIETNQRDQIGRMQGWLSIWNQPAQATGPVMQWMTDTGEHHHGGGMAMPMAGGALMPGMATSEELSRLSSLRGPEFDVYFLQLMLRHHQGGAGMAEYGGTHAAVPAVRALAKNMLGSQGSEMELMTSMLNQRGAQPLR
ncbi:DUF305 domain-containing protein [Saccharopolyspora rhizosphaerae]|uniref:DUF305 domain-containing protein n=1 Tax=Saccharopolyspora rhizosphaerae TaxID=2492662 RepID=A0A426JHH7_9PSEU|nr:DUF305 domain-containing protein [Saccharopolyspora rhizosphaerae]RRO12648.1 DUF305 domain-containing protein [Saccharopolyspora rhizosphaerae]